MVKVGDFGLVTAAENQPESSDQSPANKASARHTAEVGTQLYMSPEQVRVHAAHLGQIYSLHIRKEK